jgi:hypothetical protein
MAEDGNGHCGYDGAGNAVQDAQAQHEVPIGRALSEQQKGQETPHGAADEQITWPITIEQRPSLDAEKESEEPQNGGYPTDISDGVV